MRLGIAFFLSPLALFAQASATLDVKVADPQGAAIEAARVTLARPLSGFSREIATNSDGLASFANVPFESYDVTVRHDGFALFLRSVVLRSNVRTVLEAKLELDTQRDQVRVSATDSATLIDTESTGTRVELAASSIERMPVQAGTRGLESVLLSFPGFAANANGAIHPRGAHNQMTYVVDGMAISDQLTGSFANAIDLNIVEAVELYTGNIPAEYGSKVSGVAVITTPSGIGSQRVLGGSLEASAAQFDTLSTAARVAGEYKRFGYFATATATRSHRFLDQVSLDNLHNGGDSQRAFTRLDYQASDRDMLRLNIMTGRSFFELTNLRSQWLSGQDQTQLLRDFSASLGWLRTLSPYSTLDATASYRTSIAQLFPSPGDTPVTASQARHLSNINAGIRFNRVSGGHTLRAGGDYQRFPVSEHFTFGITSPAFNDPLSDGFDPSLAAFDLSRGGGLFQFAKKLAGSMGTVFFQDTWRLGRLMLSLGLRYDEYRFVVNGRQLQPRVGIAFHLRETGTVLRASYNRNYQTPPNENLLLSSAEEAAALVTPAVRETLGRGFAAIRPERQNVYEAGVEQRVGTIGSLTATFYHKDSHDMQDNDNFFNTGIIFPTSLARSRVNGAEARFAMAPVRGFSGSLSATHYHAVVTPPFTGGLFIGSTALDLLNSGPFVIDHDQKLGMHGMLRYAPKRGFWTSVSVRYDSGLVTNPSDPAEVAADPDYSDLLPYVDLASNPARVHPRVITDFAVGYERFRNERRQWELSLQVTNIGNTTALYNFQSVFVGTRLVTPRMIGARLRWFF
jgi:hypothetical protein